MTRRQPGSEEGQQHGWLMEKVLLGTGAHSTDCCECNMRPRHGLRDAAESVAFLRPVIIKKPFWDTFPHPHPHTLRFNTHEGSGPTSPSCVCRPKRPVTEGPSVSVSPASILTF